MLEDLITRKEAIALLHIDASTFWRWEKAGKVRRKGGLGGKVYYSKSAIERAINKNA